MFENHIEVDHNPWNYLYFIYNMKFKNDSNRRGLEVYVNNLLVEGDLQWVPMGRAACLVDVEEEMIDRKVERVVDSI